MDRFRRFLNSSLLASRTPTNSEPTVTQPAERPEIFPLPPPRPAYSVDPPKILVIGAGSRGAACARAIMMSSNGFVIAVAEPVEFKRKQFGRKYIWGIDEPKEGMEFHGWKEFMEWEVARRKRKSNGEDVPDGVDGVLVCTLDETHAEIITGLASLNLHLLSEKPLATTLDDCLRIYTSLSPNETASPPTALFAIGHVMRYSPHNMLLRKLLLEDEAVGDIISVEHTEPVGWWHFAHSYVRGNWRKETTSAPSLLTKSCHDIDPLLWLLCSPPPNSQNPPHLPSTVSSSGSLTYFKPSRKPQLAGRATNCLSCPAERDCQYSAKKIYVENGIMQGTTGWPVNIVVPEIEEYLELGLEHTKQRLTNRLAEDYTSETDQKIIDSRGWYGRCVYEADNDVCDDQVVTLAWEDDFLPEMKGQKGRGAKTASFHMVAFTADLSRRHTRIYGSRGEMVADSRTVTVHDFSSGVSTTHNPHLSGGAHGGGDFGLARQFVLAIDAVKNHGMSVAEAQKMHIGCTLEEVIRSHAFIFAAEEARKDKKVVRWGEWWQEVESRARGIA